MTVFYYNPNIDAEEEYKKRKSEQIRLLKETGWADFLDCDHDAKAFEEIAEGLEQEPERGARCYLCYRLRLEKTAKAAKERGFKWFCSTLSLSPYKNAEWVNEAGAAAGEKYGRPLFALRLQKARRVLSLFGIVGGIRIVSSGFLRL